MAIFPVGGFRLDLSGVGHADCRCCRLCRLAAAGPAGLVGRRRPLGCWVARCVLAGSEDGFRVLGESSVRLIAGLTAMNVLGHHAMPPLEASS